ncbi:uncharacterized protein LOC123529014 [Mercenaria mercenaria]|uniref:uncharacterized protein LOC123529014 n=1 Tax=Mercenaria mercenaria TaxID=6596 RepID=UPI00234E9AA2|nr:uncharacterized protein LOC123529014 [Mercenaria mercenaria]
MRCHNCKGDICRQLDGICLFGCVNGSECEDGFSTTLKRSSIVTTKFDIISSTFFPTKFTTNDQTFTTKTTTEVSVKSEDGDGRTLIVIIIIVVVAILVLCFGIVIYCIRQKKMRPKSDDGTAEQHEYTNVYAEIDNVGPSHEYEGLETEYDDIETILENMHPTGPLYQVNETERASASEINNEPVGSYEQPQDQNCNDNTEVKIPLENVENSESQTNVPAVTEETGLATNGNPSYIAEYNTSGTSSSSGYTRAFSAASLPQTDTDVEISDYVNRKSFSHQRTGRQSDVESESYCVVEKPTHPATKGNTEIERGSQYSAYADGN